MKFKDFVVVLLLCVTVLDAEKQKKSLFDNVISNERHFQGGESSSTHNREYPCDVRPEHCSGRSYQRASTSSNQFVPQKPNKASLFDGYTKESSSLKDILNNPHNLEDVKYTSQYATRSPERETNRSPTLRPKIKSKSGSLFDKFSAFERPSTTLRTIKQREKKIDRKIDILRKEKETLQNLPHEIFEKALRNSYVDTERKSSEKSLQLLAESAKKLRNLFTESLQKVHRFQPTKQRKLSSSNFEKSLFRDKKLDLFDDKRTLTDKDLEALANLLQEQSKFTEKVSFNDNFIPFVEEVKTNRLEDLLLALKIMQIIDDTKAVSEGTLTNDKDIQLLLAKSLFKRSIDSLDDLPFQQKNALTSIIKAMHGNLGEEEREQTAESISRIFTVSADDDSFHRLPSTYSHHEFFHKKAGTTKPPRPTGPPSPPITVKPPTIISTPSPPLPSVIGPPTPRPVGPPSPPTLRPTGPPAPPNPVGPPSPPRDDPFEGEDFFITDSFSDQETDDIFYLAPDPRDSLLRGEKSNYVQSADPDSSEFFDLKDENSWVPMRNKAKSSEITVPNNRFKPESVRSPMLEDTSVEGKNVVLNENGENVNYNYHYHYFTYPLSESEDTQSRQDSSKRFLPLPKNLASDAISSFLNTKDSRESTIRSINGRHSQPLTQEASLNVRLPLQGQKGSSESLDTQASDFNDPSTYVNPPSPPVANPPLANPSPRLQYGPPPAAPNLRMMYSSPPANPPPRMEYGAPPANPPPQTYGAPLAPPRNPQAQYSAPLSPPRAPSLPSTYSTLPQVPSNPPQNSYASPPAPPLAPPLAVPRRPSYGPPPSNPAPLYRAPPANPPPMSYGTPPPPPREPANPSIPTRVVFLKPKREKGKGKKGKGVFSAFSVLFGSDSEPTLRDPQFPSADPAFRYRRNSLRDEFWRTRELLLREQQEAFELQRLKLEIKAQEKQREEMKRGLFRNMLRDGIGGNIRDMFYKGAMALGAMSLVPLSSMIGRKRRSLNDNQEYYMSDALFNESFQNTYGYKLLEFDENATEDLNSNDQKLQKRVSNEFSRPTLTSSVGFHSNYNESTGYLLYEQT